jgi:hypothetical protein
MKDLSRFKTEQGLWLSRALFFETTLADKSTCLFTLKDHTHEGLTSLYEMYMSLGDLTEYEFANKYLGGWSHWMHLCKCKWFEEYRDRWREELRLHYSAAALRTVVDVARDTTNKASMQACRYLLEGGYLPKKDAAKGRPTKEAIKKQAEILHQEEIEVQETAERILGK